MDIIEFAGLLEQVAKKSTVIEPPPDPVPPIPPSPTPNIDPTSIKSAIKLCSIGGVKVLQRALSVDDDGDIGKLTNKALNNIDIQTLLNNISNQPLPPPSPLSFEALAQEYRDLFKNSTILPQHKKEIDSIANAITRNQSRYTPITIITKVPEHVIGLIHSMECNLDFSRHLHNGDPLSSRTINEPVGRPVSGNPPFTFEESAIDALNYEDLSDTTNWTPEFIAWFSERLNGFGYRKYHPEVKSPYLWSFTDVYTKGIYVSDGHFDPDFVSNQPGTMAIWKELTQWT